MYLFKRLIPLLTFFLFIGGLELADLWPLQYLYVAGGILVIYALLMLFFLRPGIRSKINLILTPTLLLAGTLICFSFIGQLVFKQILIFLSAFLAAFYLENLYTFLYRTSLYQVSSLGRLTEYINLLTAFLLFSSLYSFKIFMNWPIYPLILTALIVNFILVFEILRINKIILGHCVLYAAIGSLILSEALWVISFLPNGFYVGGLAVTIFYYAFVNLALQYLQNKWNGRAHLKYVLISVLSLILIYVTATWS